MAKEDRRSKVTPETKEESARLAKLWADRPDTKENPRLTQTEFGETFGIGNQSAVGQFLRGEVPLSLKAARGFAVGLACKIEDFSPRLAAEAAAIASMVPGGALDPDVAAIAAAINALPAKQRRWVLEDVQDLVAATRSSIEKRKSPPREDSTGEPPDQKVKVPAPSSLRKSA